MSLKHLQVKKRQHFVWANYLSRWGNGTKNVFYSTKSGNIACDSVRAIVADEYFYKTTRLTKKDIEVIKGFSRLSSDFLHQQHMSYLNSFLMMQQLETSYSNSSVKSQEIELHLNVMKCNALENLHTSHEKMALTVLAGLADERLDLLQEKQNMLEFMMFFGHQITRTKTFRDGIIQHALLRRNAKEIEVAESIEHAWWFLSYMFGMNLGHSLFLDRRNTIHALLINNTKIPFITSDQPVVNVHPCVSETEFTEPKHCDFYYPISPRIAYIICDSERFKPGKNDVDEPTVEELNAKIAVQAMVHIIGDRKSAIQSYKKLIGRRYHKASAL